VIGTYTPSSPTSIPLPTFSLSLISLTVSVDVKHHVYFKATVAHSESYTAGAQWVCLEAENSAVYLLLWSAYSSAHLRMGHSAGLSHLHVDSTKIMCRLKSLCPPAAWKSLRCHIKVAKIIKRIWGCSTTPVEEGMAEMSVCPRGWDITLPDWK